MTEQELNAIVAELAVLNHDATPAPWTHSFLGSIIAADGLVVQGGWLLAGGMAGVQSNVEAELIVKTRNALPHLLDALQRARIGKALAERKYGVLGAVNSERHRQDWRWGEQNHPDVDRVLMNRDGGCTAQRMAEHYEIPSAQRAKYLCNRATGEGELTYAHILIEEVAEAVEAATARNAAALRTELIQVAAVAVAWAEKLDRQRGRR